MNYDSKKLVSENIEDTKNLVVENKIETLFTPKTSTDIISETTLRQIFKDAWEAKKRNQLSEQLTKGIDDVNLKSLFDQLKSSGLKINWQVPNNPIKSTYMSWGPWVIWKDPNKNGGWPISFTGADKKVWLFKFSGGRYSGGPIASTNLESKNINSTFNLGSWSKVKSETGGPKLSSLAKSKPKSGGTNSACKTVDGKPIAPNKIPAVATKIYKELSYAFDGVGTYEAEAVAAYDMITCKPILDAVNAKVAARGMKGIKNVGDWAKDEMSDYDYEQYRKIWKRLQKLGYKAPPVSTAMRVASGVGDVVGVNALEKVGEGIQQLFSRPIDGFAKIVDAIRSFLGGIAGGVITTILDFTGVGKVITTIGWGLLLVGDLIVWLVKGVAKVPEMILSIINIVTTGAVAAPIGKILKPFFGKGTNLGNLIQKTSGSPWLQKAIGWVQKGMGKIGSMVSSAVKWIMSTSWWKYLAKTKIGSVINSIGARITQFVDDFSKALASGAGSSAKTTAGKQYLQKQGAKKIKGKLTTDFAKDLKSAGTDWVAKEYGGEKGEKIANYTKNVRNLAADAKNIGSVNTKIGVQRSGGGYTGPLTSIRTQTAKNVGALGKDVVKTGKNVAKDLEGDKDKTKQTAANTLGLTGAAQKALAQTKR